jgi:hypothetical protein
VSALSEKQKVVLAEAARAPGGKIEVRGPGDVQCARALQRLGLGKLEFSFEGRARKGTFAINEQGRARVTAAA